MQNVKVWQKVRLKAWKKIMAQHGRRHGKAKCKKNKGMAKCKVKNKGAVKGKAKGMGKNNSTAQWKA